MAQSSTLAAGVKELRTMDDAVSPIVEEAAPIATRPVLREPARHQAAATPATEAGIPLSYRHSEDFGEFAMALASAQGQFQDIEKNQTANVESRREGARSYTYEYADLAAILASVRPALSANGLALMQAPSVRRGAVIVTTMLVHGQSRQWFAVDLAVALENLDPQAVGSATTYARRYGVTSLLGLAAFDRDDDGQRAGVHRGDGRSETPDGFDKWWDDFQAVADNGTTALDAAWAEAAKNPKTKGFLAYAARAKGPQISQLKKRAAQVAAS